MITMNDAGLFCCNIIIILIHIGQSFSELRITSNYTKSNNVIDETSMLCVENNKQNNTTELNVNMITNFDTLTQDDVVKQQYAMLPYPEVKTGEFENIRRHYKSVHQNIPMLIAPAITLENINHFLFKGYNNFRCINVI